MRGAKSRLKRRFLAFLTVFLFFLSACGTHGDEKEELVSSLAAITGAEYTARVTASFPAREAEFTLSFSSSPEKTRICVISPEEIAGVSCSVNPDGATLEFDGAVLEIGELDESGISPLSCISTLMHSWKKGDFAEISPCVIFGKSAYLAVSREDMASVPVEYRTWFSKEDFLPLYSEIFSDGERIITCNFERGKHTEDESFKTN